MSPIIDYRPSNSPRLYFVRRLREGEEKPDSFSYTDQLRAAEILLNNAEYLAPRVGGLLLPDGVGPDLGAPWNADDDDAFGVLLGVKSPVARVLGIRKVLLYLGLPYTPKHRVVMVDAVKSMVDAKAMVFEGSMRPHHAPSPAAERASSTSTPSTPSIDGERDLRNAKRQASTAVAREAKLRRQSAEDKERICELEVKVVELEDAVAALMGKEKADHVKLTRKLNDVTKQRDNWRAKSNGMRDENATTRDSMLDALRVADGKCAALMATLSKVQGSTMKADDAVLLLSSTATAYDDAANSAAVELKKTKGSQGYEEGYTEAIASLMSDYEIQPKRLKSLVIAVLRAHLKVADDADLADVVDVPSVGCAHAIKMLRVTKHRELMKTVYKSAVGAGRPFFWLATDGGKKGRRQRQDVTSYFYLPSNKCARRFWLGLPEVTGTSGEAEWRGQQRMIDEYGMPLQFALGLTADAGDSSSVVAEAKKKKVIAELTASGELAEPQWLRLEVRGLFRVPAAYASLPLGESALPFHLLIPISFDAFDDLMHKSKNGELEFIKGMGKFILHPRAFDGQARSPRQVFFSFSRLFQKSLALQQHILDKKLPGEAPMGQVPGNVAHRLRIVTKLACILMEHYRQICAGLEAYNDAYAVSASNIAPKGGWKVGGVPKSAGQVTTCVHVADVWHALNNPRHRLETELIASMHYLSQDVYARSQAQGGLRAYRARPIMVEYRAALQQLQDHAPTLLDNSRRRAMVYFEAETAEDKAADEKKSTEEKKLPPLQVTSRRWGAQSFCRRRTLSEARRAAVESAAQEEEAAKAADRAYNRRVMRRMAIDTRKPIVGGLWFLS